ncbi:MAG TPA: glycogen synthase GlgA [Vicinamibacterales bacterium]|nr:glycogen synthase GlgA [Vicinamibacterales bacterium]
MIASEMAPFAKTGGLADVVGALPVSLERLGHDVTVVMPRYRAVTIPSAGVAVMSRRLTVGARTDEVQFHVLTESPARRVVFVDIPRLFDRVGLYEYGGRDYPDNAERFATLCAAACEYAEHLNPAGSTDVVHAHDWQAGLALAWLRYDSRRWPRTSRAGRVFTIHNLAYQGVFPKETVPAMGLPWNAFTVEGGEFWGQFSYLKTGITSSDVTTTVSPTYARETLAPPLGVGMDGVLKARGDRYIGILNGIDTDVWNPATDPLIPARFDLDNLAGKRECKRALLERFGLPVGDDALERPLIGLVSRLVDQKGLRLIQAAGAELMALDATWVFVGQGDPHHETFLRALASHYRARVGVHIGFDEALAHLVEAGADIFLMPSIFEPCGLNQMYSLRYGTVPVVHAVGGLDDTIQPYTSRALHANGFKFKRSTGEELARTMRQAVRLYDDKNAWTALMRAGMQADHSWEKSAREYVRVYRRARRDAADRGGA